MVIGWLLRTFEAIELARWKVPYWNWVVKGAPLLLPAPAVLPADAVLDEFPAAALELFVDELHALAIVPTARAAPAPTIKARRLEPVLVN